VLGKLKNVHRHLPKIQVASGILIIVMGVLLMTDNLNVLTINF
jgi:cytochrome c biogenesis protein CcdA